MTTSSSVFFLWSLPGQTEQFAQAFFVLESIVYGKMRLIFNVTTGRDVIKLRCSFPSLTLTIKIENWQWGDWSNLFSSLFRVTNKKDVIFPLSNVFVYLVELHLWTTFFIISSAIQLVHDPSWFFPFPRRTAENQHSPATRILSNHETVDSTNDGRIFHDRNFLDPNWCARDPELILLKYNCTK
jgi:hypothetical protein